MNQISTKNQQSRYCSHCRQYRMKSMFVRKDRQWATCTICSEVNAAKRCAQTCNDTAQDGPDKYNDMVERIAVLPIGAHESTELMARQLAFESQQQQVSERLQLLGSQVTSECLLDEEYSCEQSPLEQAEEFCRQQLEAVQFFTLEDCAMSIDNHTWTDSCPAPAAEDEFVSDLGSVPDIGNTVCADLKGRQYIEGLHHMDRAQEDAAIQTHAKMTVKPTRQRLEPPNLDPYFADFNHSEDLLRQPRSPSHDLKVDDPAKLHIRELGLALRLSLLSSHWHGTRRHIWFKEIEKLDRLVRLKNLTAWGPLSDWLVLYKNGLEHIEDTYPVGTELTPAMTYKLQAANHALFKSLRKKMRDEVQRLLRENKEALLMYFVERSGRSQGSVKLELDRQVRRIKDAVVQDCAVRGVLCL